MTIVLVNLQEVAGGKKFLELLLEAVNITGYRLIRRTLTGHENQPITTPLIPDGYYEIQNNYSNFQHKI